MAELQRGDRVAFADGVAPEGLVVGPDRDAAVPYVWVWVPGELDPANVWAGQVLPFLAVELTRLTPPGTLPAAVQCAFV